MKSAERKIICQTPTSGKTPTQIPAWKYDLVRGAIRRVVPTSKSGVAFKELPALIGETLTAEERAKLGSLSWHATTVKLHMEVVGELERVEGVVPQRIRRTA